MCTLQFLLSNSHFLKKAALAAEMRIVRDLLLVQEIYRKVWQVAESALSFFIMGETGVGKEGVAQYIHKSSPRRDKPFIAINCGRFDLNSCKVSSLDMKKEHLRERATNARGRLKG